MKNFLGFVRSPWVVALVVFLSAAPHAFANTKGSERSICVANALQRLFDQGQQQEFPNLFLPPELRGLNPEALLPAQKAQLRDALRSSRAATEKALQTLFERMVVPVYLNGSAEPKAMRFFELAQKLAHEVDPRARIAPSGGVVRSSLGFLYEEMLRESERMKNFNAVEFLERIARGDHSIFNSKGDVMSFDLRGVGSDFDLLLDADPKSFEAIEAKIKPLFGSFDRDRVAEHLDPDDMNKALFTIADLKPLDEQITRSVRQGGASVDLLLFDLKKGRLVEPRGVPGIVDELLQGRYRYLPPTPGYQRESPVATALRGPRALVELPFLSMRPEGEARLNQELRAILKDIHLGSYPQDKSIDQLVKLRRNARLSQANNRVARAPANTTLGLIRSIGNTLEQKRLSQFINYPLELRFNSYTPRYPLSAERTQKAQRLPADIRRHLISQADFLERYTDGGYLYHGTSTEGALSIPRGGFRQSDYEIDIRRGTFASSARNIADGYSKPGSNTHLPGYVMRLPIRKDQPILALDASNPVLIGSRSFIRIRQEAKSNGLELSDWLAKRYGIDFILLNPSKSIALIKNSEAIERVTLPSMIHDTARSIQQELERPDANFARILGERNRLEEAKPLFSALDIDIGPVPSLEFVSEKAMVALPRMTDPRVMLEVWQQLSAAFRNRIPARGYGGMTFAEMFAAAMGQDPEIPLELMRYGYHSSTQLYGFNLALQDPRWPKLLERAVQRMIKHASDSKLSAEARFEWLQAISRLFEGTENVFATAKKARWINSIPESTYEAIRIGAMERPQGFELMDDVEALLTQVKGTPVDLSSLATSTRLRQIRESRGMFDKLKGVQLLSWANGRLLYRLDEYPEVIQEYRKLVPQIVSEEDLLSRGTSILYSQMGNNGLIDSAFNQLMIRSLRLIMARIDGPEALRSAREYRWLFMDVVGTAADWPEKLNPELISELRRFHLKFHLDILAPGNWRAIKPILEP